MDTLPKTSISNPHLLIDQTIIPDNATIIIGLSGGADSVCLLHQLVFVRQQKNLTLIAAHLNHEWRPEAEQDAQFCIELCTQLAVTYVVKKASELECDFKKTGSKEDLGRQMRRRFFEQLAHEYHAAGIALAHHQDDQIETFFIRTLRGTTIQGLGCMKERDGLYLRPLLGVAKQDILTYLQTHHYTYVEDASNSSLDYLRNRIRHTVIPALASCDKRFTSKYITLIKHLQETEQFIAQETTTTYALITHTDQVTGRIHLDYKKLLNLNEYVQKRIIQNWLIVNKVTFNPSEKFLEEIIRFCAQTKSTAHAVSDSWKIQKKAGKISISPTLHS